MLQVLCIITGAQFSPKKVITYFDGLDGIICNEPGVPGTTGVYKDKPVPFGSVSVNTPLYIEETRKIEWMVDFLSQHKNVFDQNGADNYNLLVFWSGAKGKMCLTGDVLEKLGKLKIPVSISYSLNSISGNS